MGDGFLLPRQEPSDCELAFGDFLKRTAPPGYSAIVSSKSGDAADRIADALSVSVGSLEKDREVSPDERRRVTEVRIGARVVRRQEVEDETAYDWFEHGWQAIVRARDSTSGLARYVIEKLELPKDASGSLEDVRVNVDAESRVVTQSIQRYDPRSYLLSLARCGDEVTEPVTMSVFFGSEQRDPRSRILSPGGIRQSNFGGRTVWAAANRKEVAWREGDALVGVITTARNAELGAFVGSLRSATKRQVEGWIKEAEKRR